MTQCEQDKLTERVGILEEAVSDLLSYLREESNTTHDYLTYKKILDKAMQQSSVLEKG